MSVILKRVKTEFEIYYEFMILTSCVSKSEQVAAAAIFLVYILSNDKRKQQQEQQQQTVNNNQPYAYTEPYTNNLTSVGLSICVFIYKFSLYSIFFLLRCYLLLVRSHAIYMCLQLQHIFLLDDILMCRG